MVLWSTPPWASEEVASVTEIQEIQNAHLRLTRFNLDIEIRGMSGARPLHAQVQCLDAHWCVRSIGFIRVLQTPHWTIAIDDGNRQLTIARQASGASSAPQSVDPSVLLAAWGKNGGRISRGKLTVDGQQWTVDSPRDNPKRSEFYTDPISHLLRRVSYKIGLDGASTMDIVYRWLNASDLNAAAFEEATYITDNGGNVVPASGYDAYRIIQTDRR